MERLQLFAGYAWRYIRFDQGAILKLNSAGDENSEYVDDNRQSYPVLNGEV